MLAITFTVYRNKLEFTTTLGRLDAHNSSSCFSLNLCSIFERWIYDLAVIFWESQFHDLFRFTSETFLSCTFCVTFLKCVWFENHQPIGMTKWKMVCDCEKRDTWFKLTTIAIWTFQSINQMLLNRLWTAVSSGNWIKTEITIQSWKYEWQKNGGAMT